MSMLYLPISLLHTCSPWAPSWTELEHSLIFVLMRDSKSVQHAQILKSLELPPELSFIG